MEYNTLVLSNGIRVIYNPSASEVGYCGMIINTGSRDEKEEEHGIAHFIEHVIFKGTKKRKAYHILSRLDDVGGELNAYTTKEETCIYAAFLNQDLERSIELITDLTFNSVFPEKELKKEKEVIIDEINSYKDSPAELIFDDFEELIYKNQPFGRNILGTPEHLKIFSKDHITTFIQNNYNTDEMVFCVVGNYSPKKIEQLAKKYLDNIPTNLRTHKREKPTALSSQNLRLEKDTYQSHIMIGGLAYDLNHKNRLGMHLLNNILGGPGMNSRLNMSLREKRGIAYNIESVYTPYFGTGIINIYLGTDENNVNKSINIVHQELKKLRNTNLGSMQLHKAKRQLMGQLAITNENKENLMLSIGKSLLFYNKVDSLETIKKKIEKISSSELTEIANEVFNPNTLSQLIYY